MGRKGREGRGGRMEDYYCCSRVSGQRSWFTDRELRSVARTVRE